MPRFSCTPNSTKACLLRVFYFFFSLYPSNRVQVLWCVSLSLFLCVCMYVFTQKSTHFTPQSTIFHRTYKYTNLYALLMMLRIFALALKSKYQQSLCLLAQIIFVSCVSVLWCYCCCFWLQNKTLWYKHARACARAFYHARPILK